MGEHILSSERLEQVKRDFLRSVGEGWSIQVSISHAGVHAAKFRRIFANDIEVQEAFAENRSRAWVRGRGLSYITK